jgi:predicted kinase
MKKVIITIGLPASGKTIWAKELIAKEPGKWKRINKDDLRAMLDGGKWSRENEKFVLEQRDWLITTALLRGFNVIVDDTNLAPKHRERIQELVNQHNQLGPLDKAIVEIKDFTAGVSLEECIKRDQKRPNYVGEKVIRGMYNQFLKPKPVVLENDPTLPTVIVCDLDGTLALFGDANPYDRDFTKDQVNEKVLEMLNRYKKDTGIFLVSGRMDKFKEQTKQWIEAHEIPYNQLFMRKTDDIRKDTIIKKEIYENEIKGKYNVLFILDDRNSVVEMWRQEGLTCLQVQEGDF